MGSTVTRMKYYLLSGVVIPTGQRFVLGIPEGTNSSVETGAFCLKYEVKEEDCSKVIL